MVQNPFFDRIVSKAVREKWDWKDRAEEWGDNDSIDLSEEEVEEISEDMYRRIKSACYHREEYVETLPQLLSDLSSLRAEWRTKANDMELSDDDEEKVRGMFYSEMAMQAEEEVERIEWVMENYL